MWNHVNFWFKNNKLSLKQNIILINYIKKIVKPHEPCKKFFLYEPEPHLFLAIKTSKLIELPKTPKFIKKITKEYNTNDEINGDDFIQILSYFANRTLYCKTREKFGHIAHCVNNQSANGIRVW